MEKQPLYWMTSYRHSEVGYWEPCKAKTLTGAKREATAAFSGSYLDSLIKVATGDNEAARMIVATRRNDGSAWVTLEPCREI